MNSNDMRTNNVNTNGYNTNAVGNDNDTDWGWLGLLGLAGLVGLRRRNPNVIKENVEQYNKILLIRAGFYHSFHQSQSPSWSISVL